MRSTYTFPYHFSSPDSYLSLFFFFIRCTIFAKIQRYIPSAAIQTRRHPLRSHHLATLSYPPRCLRKPLSTTCVHFHLLLRASIACCKAHLPVSRTPFYVAHGAETMEVTGLQSVVPTGLCVYGKWRAVKYFTRFVHYVPAIWVLMQFVM